MTELMTRGEIANLERLIRKQERVLKAATEQRAAELKADFEAQISAQHSFDDDEVWNEAFKLARDTVDAAQAEVAKRCEEIGIMPPSAYSGGRRTTSRKQGISSTHEISAPCTSTGLGKKSGRLILRWSGPTVTRRSVGHA